jgi:hypothetical protein
MYSTDSREEPMFRYHNIMKNYTISDISNIKPAVTTFNSIQINSKEYPNTIFKPSMFSTDSSSIKPAVNPS